MTWASAPSHLRRADSDAELPAAGGQRAALQHVPHHGALLADPRRADHRTQPPLRRQRRHHRIGDGLPRLQLAGAEERRLRRRGAARERLQHLVVRQDAQRAGLDVEPGRVRSTCGRPASASNTSTASSAATATNGIRRCSRTRRPIEPYLGNPDYILDRDLADQAIAWMRMQHALAPDKPWFALLRHRHGARAASRAQGLDRQIQRTVRPGLGQGARGDARAADQARRRAAGHAIDQAARADSGVGFARRRPEAPLRAHDGGVRRRALATPTTRSAACSMPSSNRASWTTRWSSSSWATTAPAPKARLQGTTNEVGDGRERRDGEPAVSCCR